MSEAVYLDHAATCPVDPGVAGVMTAALADPELQANPSATHAAGEQVALAIQSARNKLAGLVGAQPEGVIFTSGATEADNLALLGAARYRAARGRHIITQTTEHKAVLEACSVLEKEGFEVTRLEPAHEGVLSPDQVAAALRPDTVLVSVMHANNETGAIQDIGAIGRLCRERGVLMHADCAQTFGRLPLDLSELPVDLIALSGHKIYGPKGVGALVLNTETASRIDPVQVGGAQERGMRAGTLATHQILGLVTAAEIALERLDSDMPVLSALGDSLAAGLTALPDVILNGPATGRLPGFVNVTARGVDGESLLAGLDQLVVSAGSACNSATDEPSYVLRNLGRSDAESEASVRFSLGRATTATDVDRAIAEFSRALSHARSLVPPPGGGL